MHLLATAAFGLEAVVVRELAALGYEGKVVRPGKILFEGDESAICQTNLWLRSAERVLVLIAEFPATDFGQLFDGVRAADWASWIPADGRFPVNGKSLKSQLSSVPACQKIVKKAVVEALRAQHGVIELPETGSDFEIEVALLNDIATITLDTTGVGLHKRGYRTLVGPAQIRETLAAGMLQLSVWRPHRPLWDPFCGTGTIAIEAALMARNQAPGLRRMFVCEDWPRIPPALWQTARDEARRRMLPAAPERILATDESEEALRLARRHAELAGVAEDIHFQQRDFAELTTKRQFGVVVTNPPYGERLGTDAEIEQLYRTVPLVLRRLPTWSHYVLTARLDFEKLVGQPATKRRKLYNGRIECTLFQYLGPKPAKSRQQAEGSRQEEPEPLMSHRRESEEEPTVARDRSPVQSPEATESESSSGLQTPDSLPRANNSPPAARCPLPAARSAFGGLRPEAERQLAEFGNRLAKQARHLRKWPTKRGITCYRLYDRDMPEAPFAIDRYEDAIHIAEYDRPHERTPAEHADWLDAMLGVVAKVLETPREQIFLKYRQRQRGADQYDRVGDESVVRIVQESGLKFKVNLSDYIDTGLFLDHRQTRGMVRDSAAGKRFLNLFAYTGSFTVYAAAGGAIETTTVDLSANYLNWAAENLQINGLNGTHHKFRQEDGREFVAALPREPLFDLAVVDPPTFSNSKRIDFDWDVQQHSALLLKDLALRMAPGGVVYYSTNFRRFKLDENLLGAYAVREISKQTVPEDFRNERIHRCWRLVKKGDG
jgi:23S rRNA (guanine2445-N2)-methyltransferase / 23S rRNA (guanine2069-N7)-methyltransferase